MRWTGLLLCLFFSLSVFADKGLLQHITQQAETIDSMQGAFQQKKFLGVLPQPILSTGRFEFSQQQGIVWQTLTPIKNTLTLSPHQQTESESGALSKAQGKMVGDLFMRLLTGDFSQLQQWFGLDVSGKTSAWTIELTPKSDALAAYIKTISIAGHRYTESIVINEQNGDRSDIQLQAISINGQQVSD